MKALILEDNLSLSNLLKKFLLKEGWQVQMSRSWKEASNLIDETLFDLFLIDILLPDKQGFEVLKILSQKKQMPFAKIALISGFFEPSSAMKKVPIALKKQCVFFKKPIQKEVFLKFLKDIQPKTPYNSPPFFGCFFEPGPASKALNIYLPEQRTFDSKDLIPALFLTHSKKFTGDLRIQTDNSQEGLFQFYDGTLIRLISNSKKSFFGNLLVEHGLSLPENIQKFLEDTKNSNKRLGEQLVEKQILSPQMLNFILKEQIKIRISEMLKSSSFKIKITKKVYEADKVKTEIDFNELNFIEWLADCLQTELNPEDLNKFYREVKNKKIQKSSQINRILINQKKFLNDYNFLFKSINQNQSMENIINSSQNKKHSLKLLYFGLLMKSIFLKEHKKEFLNQQKIELILDSILEKDSGDLFAVLNLPWKASVKEVEKSYKQLIQTVHPDFLPSAVPEQLRKKCEAAFEKITKSRKYLTDEKERIKYLEQQSQKDFIDVISLYEEGVKHIKQKKYKAGYKTLIKIVDHKQAPSNTILYILWAQLKSENANLTENRKRGIQIKKSIDSCSIGLRTSPLFWYVKGLFCIQIKQYEKAKELFKKSLQIEKNFTEAKAELILIKNLMPQEKQNVFNFLFKKSS